MNKWYYVRLADGWDKQVGNKNDALERVERGSAVGWWSAEPFSSSELENWMVNEPDRLIGKVVNLASKGGGLWEGVTITGFERLRLLLEGGCWVRNVFAPERGREPLTPSLKSVIYWEIARGLLIIDWEVPK